MRIVRTTALAALSLGVSATLLSLAGPAAAHTHNCVTGNEWKRVERGMTIERVHRIFDFDGDLRRKGRDPITNRPFMIRSYWTCKSPGSIWYVAYGRNDKQHPWRVTEKDQV